MISGKILKIGIPGDFITPKQAYLNKYHRANENSGMVIRRSVVNGQALELESKGNPENE
jgi:hypothetical protein